MQSATQFVGVSAIQAERARLKSRARSAEALAERRGDVVMTILKCLPQSKRESVVGAGWHEVSEMSAEGFSQYLERIKSIVGDSV